jgi:hypothetical protein
MSRDLAKASPGIRTVIQEVLRRAPEEFCNADLEEEVRVTFVDRTMAEQTALYAQGRKTLQEVNTLRKYAGMGQISNKENGRKVTWTLASRHIVDLHDDDPVNDLSRAVDLGLFWHGKYVTGETATETAHYLRLRQWVLEVAKQLKDEGKVIVAIGIVPKDLPHFQEEPPYSTER